jgi:hypothetical protein
MCGNVKRGPVGVRIANPYTSQTREVIFCAGKRSADSGEAGPSCSPHPSSYIPQWLKRGRAVGPVTCDSHGVIPYTDPITRNTPRSEDVGT